MDFCYPFKVRFSDTDSYGIVHHSRYYCYFEEARYAFARSVDTVKHMPQGVDVRFPVLTSSCEYRKPLLYDDRTVFVKLSCHIECDCKIEFSYAVIDEKGTVYAKGKTSHVVTENGETCFVLPAWLTALAEKVLKDNK